MGLGFGNGTLFHDRAGTGEEGRGGERSLGWVVWMPREGEQSVVVCSCSFFYLRVCFILSIHLLLSLVQFYLYDDLVL